MTKSIRNIELLKIPHDVVAFLRLHFLCHFVRILANNAPPSVHNPVDPYPQASPYTKLPFLKTKKETNKQAKPNKTKNKTKESKKKYSNRIKH